MIVTAQTASPTRPPDIKTFAAPPHSRFLPSSAWRTLLCTHRGFAVGAAWSLNAAPPMVGGAAPPPAGGRDALPSRRDLEDDVSERLRMLGVFGAGFALGVILAWTAPPAPDGGDAGPPKGAGSLPPFNGDGAPPPPTGAAGPAPGGADGPPPAMAGGPPPPETVLQSLCYRDHVPDRPQC